MPTRVKVCCIASVEEVRLAVSYGASAVGLVSEMPSGPGVIDPAEIAAIAATVPPGVATFLLTSRTAVDRIVAQQRACGTNVLQLCRQLPAETRRDLRQALPGIAIVQVVHITGPEALVAAQEAAPTADALLLDTGDPTARIPVLGGTGRTHDWQVSRAIRDAVRVPVFLAGGLRPENVGHAIAAVAPFGVDLCSGVRTDGRLDEDKLARFMAEVRRAHHPRSA